MDQNCLNIFNVFFSFRYSEGRTAVKAMLNLAYVLPLILTILWIRPLGRDILARPIGSSGHTL